MCSTCDCDQAPPNTRLDEEEEITSGTVNNLKQCRKCQANAYILLNKVHAECKACFLESCHKKLRSTIGRSKLVRNNDSILIAYSGGPSSSALMDLLKFSLENKFQREQKFRPSVFHVDTSQLIASASCDDSSSIARFNQLHQFLRETSQTYPGWPIYWTTLEAYHAATDSSVSSTSIPFYAQYDEQTFLSDHALLSQAHSDHLNDLKSHLQTMDLTDQQQFVRHTIESLVSKAASQINESSATDKLSFVFTGSTATKLANNLLVDVILGQGSTIHSTVAVCDKRHGTSILRPMRDFSKKEVAFYLRARGLTPKVKLNLATLTDTKDSIQRLSEVFLCRLYTDYPATYSTLLRTGNKMLH